MNEKFFPVDIFAIKEYGVDRWLNEFFWPVSDDEFAALCNDVEQCLIDEANIQTKQLKTLLVIAHKFLKLKYTNSLHALKVIKQAKSMGMDVFCLNDEWWRKSFMSASGGMDMYVPRTGKNSGKYTAFIEKLKHFVKAVIYNRNPMKYPASIKDKEVVKLVGSVNSFVKQYLESMPKWVHFTSPRDWLPDDCRYELPAKLKNELQQCSGSIVDRLSSIAGRIGIEFIHSHKRRLEQFTEGELTNTARTLHLIKRKIRNDKKIHLLIPTQGSSFYKTLSVAVQECGGRVTNFAHGGDVGLLNLPMSLASFFDIPLVNDFVTYTAESASLYAKIKANHSKCKDNRLRMLSGESDEYFKLWKQYDNGPQRPNAEFIEKYMFPERVTKKEARY